jgi:phosphatidylethanolamine-binding protein (PEBP) family uncharacterized protein
MTFTRASLVPLFVAAALPLNLACAIEGTPAGGAGTGGTGASGGTAGVGGSGGSAAGTGGAGGSGGVAGSAAGTGGGAGGGGTAGSGGAGGTAGATAGMGGAAGMSGAAGESGGMSGSAGAAGGSGMSGAAGSAGAGGASGAAGAAGQGGSGGSGGGAFTLTLEGFTPMAGCDDDMRDNCTVWPRDLQQYMNGPNLSPAMSWANAPAGTMSVAVSLQDLSNGNEHWVLWNLPGNTMMLAEDVPDDMMNQASIGSGNGYFGPGSNCNVYEFTVYALSMAMFSPSNATDPGNVFMELNALGSSALLGKASVRGRQNFSGDCDP